MPLGGPPCPETVTMIRDLDRAWRAGTALGCRATGHGNPKHWAYVAPIRPAVPVVGNQAWVPNPIDAFILSRLEKKGCLAGTLPETLIRRGPSI